MYLSTIQLADTDCQQHLAIAITVKNKKDNQREVVMIEVAAWACVLYIVYIFTKILLLN